MTITIPIITIPIWILLVLVGVLVLILFFLAGLAASAEMYGRRFSRMSIEEFQQWQRDEAAKL